MHRPTPQSDPTPSLHTRDLRIVEIVPITAAGHKWLCVAFEEGDTERGDDVHLALLFDPSISDPQNLFSHLERLYAGAVDLPVRIHSECLLGDALASSMCDCGDQLDASQRYIINAKRGCIIYLRQEGRGIGLRAKLSCLALQEGYRHGERSEHRHSPDQANVALGYPIDSRSYVAAGALLRTIAVRSIALISGNPQKRRDLTLAGIQVTLALDLPRRPSTMTARSVLELKEKMLRAYAYPSLQ